MQCVYILKCNDKKTYIGCTDNLKERLERHRKGYIPATKARLPVKLLSYFAFNDKYKAFSFEKYLKSGSGRAFLKRHLFFPGEVAYTVPCGPCRVGLDYGPNVD